MDGMRLVVPVHFHGTMAANGLFRWKVPWADAGASAGSSATRMRGETVKVGTNGDDDLHGGEGRRRRGAPNEYDRADFVDAEYPHIPAGTVL